MKTKEELKALKNEVEALIAKLTELSEEEMMQVSGGITPSSKTLAIGNYAAGETKNQSCGISGKEVPIHPSSIEYFDY